MAGGPHGQVVACVVCRAAGRVTRAERIATGLEDDTYRCEAGHRFGIDWSVDGPPTEPQWPPPVDLDELLRPFPVPPPVSDAVLADSARACSDAERRELIGHQIAGCLERLVSPGTGSLGSYGLEPGSLELGALRALPGGGVEVAFTALGWLETENEPDPDAGADALAGTLALDALGRTGAGPDGRTALHPWTTRVPPGTWTPQARLFLQQRLEA